MRGRRVWVLHGDQLIVYFLDSFLYFTRGKKQSSDA
jgi:translation initiation factor IF-1